MQSVTACVEGRKGAEPVVGLTWTLTVDGADTSTHFIATNCMTFVRNTQLGLDEPAYNFFTAQTFMVRKSLNVAHMKELNGATICVLTGTTLETNIADYNRANNIKINTLLFDKPEEAFAAADAGRCDGYTDDGGSVAAARSTTSLSGLSSRNLARSKSSICPRVRFCRLRSSTCPARFWRTLPSVAFSASRSIPPTQVTAFSTST